MSIEAAVEDDIHDNKVSVAAPGPAPEAAATAAADVDVVTDGASEPLAEPLSPATVVEQTKALKVIGIDDDPMSRDVQVGLMEHMLHADMERSGALGATSQECERFVDVALGRLDLSLQTVDEEDRQCLVLHWAAIILRVMSL